MIDPNVIAANPGQPGLVIGGASSGHRRVRRHAVQWRGPRRGSDRQPAQCRGHQRRHPIGRGDHPRGDVRRRAMARPDAAVRGSAAAGTSSRSPSMPQRGADARRARDGARARRHGRHGRLAAARVALRRPGARPDPRRDAPPTGVRRRRQPRAANATRDRPKAPSTCFDAIATSPSPRSATPSTTSRAGPTG